MLGSEASEERAKQLGVEISIIHFATHGLLDERFPLNSSLALSIPGQSSVGQENGLLQAWEIFEQLRLNADLVVLSACDTALGIEIGGEGLIGLTRAFQYAGARSVLASLWSVYDESTAELMKRFHGYLQQGQTKDQALRLAQIDLLNGALQGRATHPFTGLHSSWLGTGSRPLHPDLDSSPGSKAFSETLNSKNKFTAGEKKIRLGRY